MALKIANRAKETTTTTGTGTISLLGAVASFQKLVNGAGNGNSVPYLIDNGAGEWELTWGTLASGSPDTITRGTLIKSSTGSRINFSAGTKTVAIVSAAELILWVGQSDALVETSIASAGTTDLGTILTLRAGVTGTTTITSFGTHPNLIRWVRFVSAGLTLTHNATSLILKDGINRVTAAGDIGQYISDGSGNWTEVNYISSILPGGSVTLSDQSGAALSLTNLSARYTRDGDEIRVFGRYTYPATASGANNFIGGLPFTVTNNDYGQGGGCLTYCTETTAKYCMATKNSTGFALYDSAGTALTNATLSGDTVWFSITYKI